MSQSPAFEVCAEWLEKKTTLSRLEARGTLRIALKDCGFASDRVRANEVASLVEHILKQELESRGIEEAEEVCRFLGERLAEVDDGDETKGHRPDDVSRRVVETG